MIKRERYMGQIRPFIGKDLVKVLTGIRRCGKSVMLELIQDELVSTGISHEQFISINLEQLENAHLCTAQTLHAKLRQRIDKINGKAYLFLDEIQEVSDWEQCINSLRVDADCDIYITGSNAKLLSGELATYLAGRYVTFAIYPFSFSEFLDMIQQTGQSVDIATAFRQYTQFGGMPFLSHLLNSPDACFQYLRDVGNAIMLKDIVSRHSIRDIDQLERIVRYIFANIGQPFSATSLSKYFKNEKRTISTETVLNYIRFCTEACLFHKVSREDLVGKKLLSINEKYYVTDHGLREALYGNNKQDINLVLENIVYIECLRRGYQVTIGKTGSREIDFIASKNGNRLYIQVAYLLATPETIEREFNVFQNIKDNYPKYVISMDEFDMSRDGIRHCNIRDFLLKPDWE